MNAVNIDMAILYNRVEQENIHFSMVLRFAVITCVGFLSLLVAGDYPVRNRASQRFTYQCHGERTQRQGQAEEGHLLMVLGPVENGSLRTFMCILK